MKPLKVPLEITRAHYRIYDSEGKPATFEDMIKTAGTADVVFIGETHDDPAAHFLEAAILKGIHSLCVRGAEPDLQRPVVLSLEMFERDVQPVLDEYLAGLISERHFLTDSRAWSGYMTDYRPLIEFAYEKKIPVIAANAPRRYVNRVSRLGPESLADLSFAGKSWLPPLPYPPASSEYRAKIETFGKKAAQHGSVKKKKDSDKTVATAAETEMLSKMRQSHSYMTDAQALWDATMAFSISEELSHEPGSLVLNINGRFHSEQGMGIPEHLRHYCPGVQILTVTILSEKNFPNFDEKFRGFGDFVIITDPGIKHQRSNIKHQNDRTQKYN